MRILLQLFLAVVLASLFSFKKLVDSSLLDQVYWRNIDLEGVIFDDFNHVEKTDTNVTSHALSSEPKIFENNISTIVRSPSIVTKNQTSCEASTAWVNQPRIRNTNPGSAHVDTALTNNALSIADDLLGQTFCHEEGRFRTTSAGDWNTSDLELLKDWEFKLIYLAIHDIHHRPAREDYQERVDCPHNQAMMPTNDFQCRGTKFLVSSIANLGMGAAVRLGAVSHVLSAIAIGRVPLFAANTEAGPKFLQEPWYLASCDRKDLQCVFLPTSPCTLLDSDLENAFVINGTYTRTIRRQGNIPDHLDHHRVLLIEPGTHPAKGDVFPGIHKAVRRKVYERAVKLLAEWNATSGTEMDESKLHFLQEAARRITRADEAPNHPHYAYGHRHYRIPHAILLYLLRPNKNARTVLDEHMSDIFHHPVTPETTIGLPIRGSDKCHRESTCLGFDQYMRLAKETWEDSSPLQSASGTSSRGSLIMTTEDEEVFRKRVQYNETVGFPLDFIVNEKDSLQGSGNVRVFGQDADDIMLSSLVALRMQLHSGHIFGNCCSNFHLMLFDLVHEGCGLTTQATCLQETKDYNICCAWTRNSECDDIRREYQRAHETPRDKAIREAREIVSNTTRSS
jgi:hypothetical protein